MANSKYSEDFKRKVGLEAARGAASLKSLGEKYGVNPTLVRNWRIAFGEAPMADPHPNADEISSSEVIDADDVEGEVMEVIATDDDGVEYVYWVDLSGMPESEDEYDWAIEKAVAHHLKLGLPNLADEDCEAMEPFSRAENEFVWVR